MLNRQSTSLCSTAPGLLTPQHFLVGTQTSLVLEGGLRSRFLTTTLISTRRTFKELQEKWTQNHTDRHGGSSGSCVSRKEQQVNRDWWVNWSRTPMHSSRILSPLFRKWMSRH